MGAPVMLARSTVLSQVQSFRYYAGLAGKIPGETWPEDGGEGLFKMVVWEPLGVCAGISAWNAGQLFAGWKVGGLLAEYPAFGVLVVFLCFLSCGKGIGGYIRDMLTVRLADCTGAGGR